MKREALTGRALAVAIALLLSVPAVAEAAPDLDGDGSDDLVAGAYLQRFDPPGGDVGSAKVIYGADGTVQGRHAELLSQSRGFIAGDGPEVGDRFATAIATGDFDGDGHDDVALGSPAESIGRGTSETPEAGAVTVIYGDRGHIRHSDSQFASGNTFGDIPLPGDHFGEAVAGGDFNGDGYDDLAIGQPGEDAGDGPADSGAVFVVPGTRGGLNLGRAKRLRVRNFRDAGIGETTGARLGSTLVAGNFNRDRFDELVVGTQEEAGAGSIYVLPGTRKGARGKHARRLTAASGGIGGAGAGRHFSGALSVGDFDDDRISDLAVGSPGAELGGGAVSVIPGSRRGGLRARRALYLPASSFARDASQAGGLGSVLAAGDLDDDSSDDLAIGTRGTDSGDCIGDVEVVFGSPSGVDPGSAQNVTQASPGIRGGGSAQPCDRFGSALAILNADGKGPMELAIGEPRDDEPPAGTDRAGAVHLLYPNRSRNLTRRGYRYLTLINTGTKPAFDGVRRDGFGAVMATPAP